MTINRHPVGRSPGRISPGVVNGIISPGASLRLGTQQSRQLQLFRPPGSRQALSAGSIVDHGDCDAAVVPTTPIRFSHEATSAYYGGGRSGRIVGNDSLATGNRVSAGSNSSDKSRFTVEGQMQRLVTRTGEAELWHDEGRSLLARPISPGGLAIASKEAAHLVHRTRPVGPDWAAAMQTSLLFR